MSYEYPDLQIETHGLDEVARVSRVLLVPGSGMQEHETSLGSIHFPGVTTPATPETIKRVLAVAVMVAREVHENDRMGSTDRPLVIFSGSCTNPRVGMSEAHEMKNIAFLYWASLGISPDSISYVIEPFAYDTSTNLQQAGAILEGHGLDRVPVTIVSSRSHMHRILNLAARHLIPKGMNVAGESAEDILSNDSPDLWRMLVTSPWYPPGGLRGMSADVRELVLRIVTGTLRGEQFLRKVSSRRVTSWHLMLAGHPVAEKFFASRLEAFAKGKCLASGAMENYDDMYMLEYSLQGGRDKEGSIILTLWLGVHSRPEWRATVSITCGPSWIGPVLVVADNRWT
ncbi:MAG: YdcF family protein [Candidatus Dojkabacteria bacterium]|nr:YdcF family protein [Candidatus Dojkabacteria bacterium]